jgi:hypothetical protein
MYRLLDTNLFLNHEKKINPPKSGKILTLDTAFGTTTSDNVMRIAITLAYLSVAAIAISMPSLAFYPGGVFDEDGRINFISVGFLKHSFWASLIYGVGSTYIGILRMFGVIIYIDNSRNAGWYMMVMLMGLAAGIGTTRYDEMASIHLISAVLWILSSLAYHGGVTAWNKTFAEAANKGRTAKVCWLLNTVFALLLITFMTLATVHTENKQFYLISGIFEYITVGNILVLDTVLIYSIQTRYVLNVYTEDRV